MRLVVSAGIVWVMIVLAGVVGWVMNIVKLIGMGADPITGLFVARVVGIFLAPLGSVLGLFV